MKELLGENKIEVIGYTGGRLIALHSGSAGPLLIEHVTERADSLNYSKVIPIHEVLAEGHVPRFPVDTISDEVRGFPVEGVSDDEWGEMKSGKVVGVEPYFSFADAPGLKTLTQHLGARLRTFEAKCNVRFRRVEPSSESTNQDFSCVGIMMKRP